MSAEGIFPTILASTVHDIKTSLGTLVNLIRQLQLNQTKEQVDNILQLEFEANRINHSLMQLLVMYRIDRRSFSLNIDEYLVIDILNEAKSQQNGHFQRRNIDVQVACDEELLCFCDFQQVSNALSSILNNADRYCRKAIRISAVKERDYVTLCIEDDGVGYPEQLLASDLRNPSDPDWVCGNAGLGLCFVSAIAHFHKNRDSRGFVKIDNHSSLGGARFCLFLPSQSV
ncbi:MAG: sensor histidine kinase [Gammaproteobacteria bacterium]